MRSDNWIKVTLPEAKRPHLITIAMQQIMARNHAGRWARKDCDESGCAKQVWKVLLNGKDYALKWSRGDDQLPMELVLSMVRNPLRKHVVPYIAWRHIKCADYKISGWWGLQPWAKSYYKSTNIHSDNDSIFKLKSQVGGLCSDLHTNNVAMHRGSIKIIDFGCAENCYYEGPREYKIKQAENQRQSVSIGRPDAKQGMAADFRHDFEAIERRMLAQQAQDMRRHRQMRRSLEDRGLLGHPVEQVADARFIAWAKDWNLPNMVWGDTFNLKARCIHDEMQMHMPTEQGMMPPQNNVKPQPNPVGIDRAARKYGAPAPRNARW